MANDNKNTHELAPDLDDDTSELEMLPATYADPALDYEAESDAATYSFESPDAAHERRSAEALRTALWERDDHIGRLEYDLEQLRARTSGLETELKAREALTEGVSAELGETRQALHAARDRLEDREQAFADLEARLQDSESALQDARQEAAAARAASTAAEARIAEDGRRVDALAADLEQARSERQQALDATAAQARLLAQVEERQAESRSLVETLRQYIDGRKERWEQQDILLRSKDELIGEQERRLGEYASGGHEAQAAAAQDDTRALLTAEIDSLATQLAEITSEYEQERGERQSLEAQCTALEERVAELAAELATLEPLAERSARLQRENERLGGGLLGYTDEIRALQAQAVRADAYADTLRRQLQEQAAELLAINAAHASTRSALADARAEVAKLREQVEDGSRAAAAAQDEERAARERLEKALEEVRAELAEAQATVAETRAANEQLASELAEAAGSNDALETRLGQAAEEHRQEIEKLTQQARKLEQELMDSETKLANKDAAIGVLLAELAGKPQAGPSEVQADGPPQRTAERRQDEKHGAEKERTTRLLVGTIDGQEVRFPLFKNKLTIGRTAHNDIQLKQQFISRRHAVVVCDNDNTRIVDWGSKNGICVNGIRVSEKVLKNGDQLTVGTAEFRFEERPKR